MYYTVGRLRRSLMMDTYVWTVWNIISALKESSTERSLFTYLLHMCFVALCFIIMIIIIVFIFEEAIKYNNGALA